MFLGNAVQVDKGFKDFKIASVIKSLLSSSIVKIKLLLKSFGSVLYNKM